MADRASASPRDGWPTDEDVERGAAIFFGEVKALNKQFDYEDVREQCEKGARASLSAVSPPVDADRLLSLADWIERDRREPDKVLTYAQQIRSAVGRAEAGVRGDEPKCGEWTDLLDGYGVRPTAPESAD